MWEGVGGHPQAPRWDSVPPAPCTLGRAVGYMVWFGWQRGEGALGGGIPAATPECRTEGAVPTAGAASQHGSRQSCLPQPGIESLFTH